MMLLMNPCSCPATFVSILLLILVIDARCFCDGFTSTFTAKNMQTTKKDRLPLSYSHSLSSSSLRFSTLETAGGVFIVGIASFVLYVESAPSRVMQRQQKRQYQQEDANARKRYEEKEKFEHVKPKEHWQLDELKNYDGTSNGENGPILFAADGIVFNVSKGRNFYGPGGEYHIFAGRDATRLLARTIVEEETYEDSQKQLTIGERAALAGWLWTFKNKYEIVGKLEGFDETTTAM